MKKNVGMTIAQGNEGMNEGINLYSVYSANNPYINVHYSTIIRLICCNIIVLKHKNAPGSVFTCSEVASGTVVSIVVVSGTVVSSAVISGTVVSSAVVSDTVISVSVITVENIICITLIILIIAIHT